MEQKRYDMTVFGCATSVYVLKVHQLPCAGKSTWIDSTDISPFNGGVGFNISMGLSSLGLKVRPVLSCSDSRLAGLLREEVCKKYGWPAHGILEPPCGVDHRCYMFQDDNRDHMTIVYRSMTSCGEENLDAVPVILHDEYIDKSAMIILASPRPVNTEPILRLIQKKERSFVFSYRNDPTIFPPAILREILTSASILFMNQAEADEVLTLLHLPAIEELFRIGRAQVLVKTIGKRGSVVYSREKNGTVSSFTVPVTENAVGNVDAVGAGDAYLSGFMYGYMNHKSLRLCAQYGSTMSSFVIEKEGSTTNIPTLEQMLERNRMRPDALYE